MNQTAPILPTPTPTPRRNRRGLRILSGTVGAIALFGVGTAVGSAGAKTTAATPAPTVTVTAPGQAAAPAPTVTVTKIAAPASAGATMPGDGTFLVGTSSGDWAPGTWQSPTPDSGNCYYEVDSDLSGSTNSIITNNNSAGPTVMSVPSSAKAVKVSGCNTWHKIG